MKKLTKKDLTLLCAVAASNHSLKVELNYICFGKDGVIATNSRSLVVFKTPLKCCDLLMHHKILKGFVSTLAKNELVSVKDDEDWCFLNSSSNELSVNNADFDYKYPSMYKMIDSLGVFTDSFRLDSLNDLIFELATRGCFIQPFELNPLIKNADCDFYLINYKEADAKNNLLSAAMISGTRVDEETKEETVVFDSYFLGWDFKKSDEE